jgi:hypothetical protein
MSSTKSQANQPDAKEVLGQLAGHLKSTSKQKCRAENRSSSGIGIVVVPIHNNATDLSVAFSAIAKDVSTTGIGVIASHPISTPEAVICLLGKPGTRLFRGLIHHNKELGRGWVRFGVKVTEVLDNSKYSELTRFVALLMR